MKSCCHVGSYMNSTKPCSSIPAYSLLYLVVEGCATLRCLVQCLQQHFLQASQHCLLPCRMAATLPMG